MAFSTVLNHACNGVNVGLIAADIDLLVVLIYYWNSFNGDDSCKVWSYKEAQSNESDIGNITDCRGDVRKYLRLVYTFCGFDTNSAVYKQGKLPVVKPLEKFETLREEADLLLPRSRTPGTIYEAWMRMFFMLCCGKASDSLTDLKYLNENGFISRTIKWEFTSNLSSCFVSCILGMFSTSRAEHTYGKNAQPIRMGVEVRRWVFDNSFGRMKNLPKMSCPS